MNRMILWYNHLDKESTIILCRTWCFCYGKKSWILLSKQESSGHVVAPVWQESSWGSVNSVAMWVGVSDWSWLSRPFPIFICFAYLELRKYIFQNHLPVAKFPTKNPGGHPLPAPAARQWRDPRSKGYWSGASRRSQQKRPVWHLKHHPSRNKTTLVVSSNSVDWSSQNRRKKLASKQK